MNHLSPCHFTIMNSDSVYKKLATLFDFENSEKMLRELTEVGIIAGGSIVWCLKDIKTSGVDLFVDYDCRDKVQAILKRYTTIRNVGATEYAYNVRLVGGKVPLQVIEHRKAVDIDLLFDHFDMDYCRCGLWKGELFVRDDCKEAHDTMVCRTAGRLPHRNEKAILKGFTIPYCYAVSYRSDIDRKDYEKYQKNDYERIFPSLTSARLIETGRSEEYFERDQSLTDPRFVGFSPKHGHFHDVNGEDLRHWSLTMRLLVNGNEVEQDCFSFPVELTVLSVDGNVVYHEVELANPLHTHFKVMKYGFFDPQLDVKRVYSATLVEKGKDLWIVLQGYISDGYWLPKIEFD